jgi:hypothetical protein
MSVWPIDDAVNEMVNRHSATGSIKIFGKFTPVRQKMALHYPHYHYPYYIEQARLLGAAV